MSSELWSFAEFERDDPHRASKLQASPTWDELVRQTCLALSAALKVGDARFGFDESSLDHRDLRANVQFPLGHSLFDWLFNGHEGYRAQFRVGQENGLAKNARLILELCAELRRSAPHQIDARLLTQDFEDKGPMTCTLDQVLVSMDRELSKVWICERLIGASGGIRQLFVSRTGPRLLLSGVESWSSFFPEDAPGWLDVKGAFVGSAGSYQLKSPRERAAKLEERGSA